MVESQPNQGASFTFTFEIETGGISQGSDEQIIEQEEQYDD